MDKFILNTEDKNAYGYTVLTKGIDLSEFNENPLMLGNHEVDEVLGKWINLQYEFDSNGKEILTGEAEFDTDDDEVLTLMNKINKGYVLGTSIGAQILEATIDEATEEMIVTKCLLKEVSITALPANKKAKKVNNQISISLSYNGLTDIEEIKNQIKLGVFTNHPESKIMKEIMENVVVEPVLEVTEPIVEPVLEVTEPIIEPNKKGKKVELTDALTLSERLVKVLNIELSENDNEFTKIILTVGDLMKESKKVITDFPEYLTLTERVKSLELQLNQNKVNKIELCISEAIKSGKIKESSKELYLKLADNNLETLEQIFESIEIVKVPSIKLSDFSKDVDNTEVKKDYDWYAKNASKELETIKLNNKPLFDQLFKAKFNTEYKG